MNPTCALPSPDRCFRERPAKRLKSPDPGPAHLRSTHPGSGHLGSGHLESLLRRMIGGISHWRRRRAALRELRALNDHYLADIGLERVQTVSRLDEMIRERSGGPRSAIASGKIHGGGPRR